MNLPLAVSKLAAVPAALSAGGSTPTFDVVSVMTNSVGTVETQAFGVLGVVVPVIVTITGAVVGIKFGISWLRKIKG